MLLRQNFFDRPVLKVAPEMLGKVLVRRYREKEITGMITEVEAYDGLHDKASHASRGLTPRNHVMFGEAGYFYVYLVYGMHWMLNIVTGEEGYPAAVLIRAVEIKRCIFPTIVGKMQRIDGPGRVTKFLCADKRMNGKLASPENGLWFEDTKNLIRPCDIQREARIGVQYAGSVWARKPYRFLLNH